MRDEVVAGPCSWGADSNGHLPDAATKMVCM